MLGGWCLTDSLSQISNELKANAASLKEKKKGQKELASEINAHKEEIDRLKNLLALKKGEKGEEVAPCLPRRLFSELGCRLSCLLGPKLSMRRSSH